MSSMSMPSPVSFSPSNLHRRFATLATVLWTLAAVLAVSAPAQAETGDALPADRIVYVERLLPPQQTNYCGMIYTTRLVVADAAGGGNKRVLVTNQQNCYSFGTVALNPQRTTIATTIGGALHLYDVAALLAGNTQPRVFTERAYCDVPAWNSDGTRILCRWAWNTMLVVDPATLRLVRDVPFGPLGFTAGDGEWLPDGDLMIAGYAEVPNCPTPGTTRYSSGLWRVRLLAGQHTATPVLAPSCDSAWNQLSGIRISPSGTRFAAAFSGTGQSFGASLVVGAIDGSGLTTVASASMQTAYGRVAWSPSGRYLLAEAYQQDDTSPFGMRGHIDVVDVTTSSTRRLIAATSSADAFSPGAAEPADHTAPVVTGTADRSPFREGWYNRPTTITWTATDPDDAASDLSVPPPTVADMEGAHVAYTSGPACDPAGNCATGQYQVSLDRTAPIVVADLSTAANDEGWHHLPVTVSFVCSDVLSGIHSCPDPVTVVDDGFRQAVARTSVDTAGNSTDVTAVVNVDTTRPSISATATRSGDGTVTVTFACADALSGIRSCSAPVALTDDGADQVVNGTAVDMADNTATTTVTVSVDRTRPLITAVRSPANVHGWNDGPVTVTFACSDSASGIATCPEPITLSTEGSGQTVSGTATDHAGNTATATAHDINIDTTPPSFTATLVGTRNVAGWYNSPPTIRYTCADSLSGIDTCPADKQVSDDGADQTIVATATDRAGNTTQVSTTGLNVDMSPPTVQVTGVSPGATYPFAGFPNAGCLTTDDTSGVAQPAVIEVARDATGLHTATCAGGTDLAGNQSAPSAVTFRVTQTAAAQATLTSQYISASGAPDANGTMHDLANKLRNGQICEYIAKVQAEVQKPHPALTQAQAAELVYWARLLDPDC